MHRNAFRHRTHAEIGQILHSNPIFDGIFKRDFDQNYCFSTDATFKLKVLLGSFFSKNNISLFAAKQANISSSLDHSTKLFVLFSKSAKFSKVKK